MTKTDEIAKEIAFAGLRLGAIKLDPKAGFVWASGNLMPIYNDNRIFLSAPYAWGLIIDSLVDAICEIEAGKEFDIIAGTATAGIPHAAALAYRLDKPMIYIRDKAKNHGLNNQIEGLASPDALVGKKVLLIEDLISTGKSSAMAVQAIRDAGGECDYCLSIFNYGFEKSKKMFQGEESFGEKDAPLFLQKPCAVRSLLDYETLLHVAKESDYLPEKSIILLTDWSKDPFGWAEKRIK